MSKEYYYLCGNNQLLKEIHLIMIKRVFVTIIMIVAAISMMAQSLDWNSVVYQANNGDEKSMYIYSYYSIYGEEYGIKKDYKGAVTMLQKLVAKTPVTDYIIMGYVLLGDCYEKGYGVIKDIDTAREWWTLATNYNNVNAQVKIAEFYNKDENEAISEFAAPPAPPKEEEKPKEEPKPELKPEPKPAPELIFTAVEQKAIYPGGAAALLQWISANISYPTKLRQEGIEGRVYVKFVVEKDGSIGDVEIARGKHVSLDAEAVRVVKKIPKKFTPAKQNGQVVRSWFTLPITFKLPSNDNLTITVKGVSFNMIKVEGGTFQMGAQNNNPNGENYVREAWGNETPVHNVTLSDYYIGETEVTQELWGAVMGSNPSNFNGLNNPVEYVSWNDCQEFIKKLNQLTGKNFRLPTEAEWEYAARGGNKGRGYKYSGSNTIDDVAWYDVNAYNVGSSSSSYGTHPVGVKLPNELGLYDMSGNVWEWCSDWYSDWYGKNYYSSSPQTNPSGPTAGTYRVLRGGGWNGYADNCRVSHRTGVKPAYRFVKLGLRLVCSGL